MKTSERGVFVMIENEITEFKREYTVTIGYKKIKSLFSYKINEG